MACLSYDLNISAIDTGNAFGNTNPAFDGVVLVSYYDCSGSLVSQVPFGSGTFPDAICSDTTFGSIALEYYQSDSLSVAGNSSATLGLGVCAGPSPTPTPTLTNTETPTNTPTYTETPTNTPTYSETPTNTPTYTPTPTNTPTVTQTSGTIVQFVDCITGTFTFRFGGGSITPLTVGQVYLIENSLEFSGCATVVASTGSGPLYSAVGTTFTNLISCADPLCPSESIRAALLINCNTSAVFYANVEESTAFLGAAYIYNGQCYSFVEFSGPGGPYLGGPDYANCSSCIVPPPPNPTPSPTPTSATTIPCSVSTYCLNTSLPLLSGYSGNYTSFGGYYNCYKYYEGGGTNYGVIYYTGSYWCLSNSLGGVCILRGPSCFSECPQLDTHIFYSGSCISPTPTPIQCNLIDFEAYFECNVPPIPDCDVVDFVATGVTITPTPTPTINPCLYNRAVNFSMSAYTPASDVTPTPTPSITPTNNLIFTGNVEFEIFTEQFNCVSSKVLVDCSTGEEYYVSDSLVYSGTVVVTGITMQVNINGTLACVTYDRDVYNTSSNSILQSINSIYGSCGSCFPTATPTPTPSITPSISLTPSQTPSQTPTQSIGATQPPTPTMTPTMTYTPSSTPNYVYVYESCDPLQFIPYLPSQIIQTLSVSGVSTGDYFQDNNSNCWRYLGPFGVGYVPPINVVPTTYTGNYFGTISTTLYQDCTSCKTSTVVSGGCITLALDSSIPNQPDSCGGYDATRVTYRATFIDPVTLNSITATSNINVQLEVSYSDCLETFTQIYEINILAGQTTGTVSYLAIDRGFCPGDTSGQCFGISRTLVGINQILPSNIIQCP